MSEEYQKKFNREELSLNEKEVIDILVDWHDKNGKQDLRHLKHFVTPDLELQEYFEIKGLYVGTNILRQELGFNKNEKPGDFDIMIIPYSELGIHFERTAVCEVKIVRPTRQRPQKNANSLGITQLNGLIKDGFPFVGLIHISLTEPLKEHEKIPIDYCTLPVGDYTPFEKGKTFKDYLVKVKLDHFQWYSADKQMQRLLSSEIPKYVGLLCFGLTQKNKDYWLETVSVKYSGFEKGYFNPNSKKETILKVANHFKNYPYRYIKK